MGGSLFGTYYNRQIGITIDDWGFNCDWRGYHVHEWDTPVNSSTTTTRNTSKYPTASSCNTNCGQHKNNVAANWTRRFSWAEGAP